MREDRIWMESFTTLFNFCTFNLNHYDDKLGGIKRLNQICVSGCYSEKRFIRDESV